MSAAHSASRGDVARHFESSMIEAGTQPEVAAELERRIEIIERDEMDDPSRLPLSVREVLVYVGVTVLAVVVGAVMVAL
jgi:hypothetical protein